MTDRYGAAGVNLDAASEAKRRIGELARGTRTALALGGIGAFGGMVRVPPGLERPVLVLSTDGVGHQGARRGPRRDARHGGRGSRQSLRQRHSGARRASQSRSSTTSPTGKLDPDVAAAIVAGVARGCLAHEMTLVGGETAELPDLYQAGHYDLAGTIVGVVEEAAALHGDRVRPGDVLIGFEANGLHTNGYTLARHIVFERLHLDVGDPFPDTKRTVAEVLLDVHRSYAAAVTPVLPRIHALAHITGGGIAGNLVRVLPEGCEALVDSSAWPWPVVFRVLMRAGSVSLAEMRRVFNLGVGMIAVAARDDVETIVRAAERAHVPAFLIGEVFAGTTRVRFAER